MEISPSSQESMNTIVCCVCGVSIEVNPSYRCLPCLRLAHDIAADIPKQVTILFCRGCDRYLEPPSQWLVCKLESKELLSLCLKKLRGLDKVRLVDAIFLYTEPHCRRLKLKVTVQSEVDGGAVLQQIFEVEYTISNQFCSDCHRAEAKDFWTASVQIRQKVDHQRTFYYLEQLMIKHDIGRLSANIKPVQGGIDLFFDSERQARKVVEFVSSSVICKTNHSKKLISHDVKSNIYNYKFTYVIEIAPVCKDSAICLPPKQARIFGGISPICLVKRVARQVVLIDPNTAQTAEVNSLAYFKSPFHQMVSTKHLTRYSVMDIEESDVKHFAGQGHISHKHTVCDVWVQRISDIGTDKQTFCRTHLGNVLNIGDTVMGYDLQNCNLNNSEVDKLKDEQVPDVLLVKKHYGDKSIRNRRRKWKLRTMGVDDKNSKNKDYMDFLDDLEEDPVMRQNVNVYRDDTKGNAPPMTTGADDEELDDDVPTIGIEEMLEELSMNAGADASDLEDEARTLEDEENRAAVAAMEEDDNDEDWHDAVDDNAQLPTNLAD